MSDTFVGLDGEMTGGGRDPKFRPGFKFYQLVQIGVALQPDEVFVSNIGYDTWNEEPEAMDVHKLTAEQIRAAPRSTIVDANLSKWLEEHNVRRGAIPVGWNVGAFDMPYVREYLPVSGYRMFSMRSVDLNAVAFTIMQITGRSYNSVKGAAKQYAERELRKVQQYRPNLTGWHNAGYDAAAALLSWRFFQQMLVMREIHDHF